MPSFASTWQDMLNGTLDPAVLERLFKEDDAYRKLVEAEYQVLVAAAARDAALTVDDARRALATWRTANDARRAHLEEKGGAALIRADAAFTYIEGTGRYTEVKFLSEPRLHPARPLTGDPQFRGFASFPQAQGYEGLVQRKLGARYYYAIGMHLALVLDRAQPDWKASVADTPEWIVGLARGQAAPSR